MIGFMVCLVVLVVVAAYLGLEKFPSGKSEADDGCERTGRTNHSPTGWSALDDLQLERLLRAAAGQAETGGDTEPV